MSRSRLGLAMCSKRLVSVSSRVTFLIVSVSSRSRVLVSKVNVRFLVFTRSNKLKKSFYDQRPCSSPPSLYTVYMINLKRMALRLICYISQRIAIHLHMIRLFSSLAVFRVLHYSAYIDRRTAAHIIIYIVTVSLKYKY